MVWNGIKHIRILYNKIELTSDVILLQQEAYQYYVG